ncbi:MAG TPA: MmgE/PrpD family protein [Burkholderiales bacterium]|nr:MmgE/PrpD family protein [Burkholderiales bacterium]
MAYVVERLATWAERFRGEALATGLAHHAKRAVVDLHAAMLSGAVAPPATLLERALAEELDRGKARLALGRRATARAAALINGTAAHTTEVDDIFRDGIFHPGAATIPAALAAAQARGASGLQFVRAVIVGYEISTRIGAAMGRAHYRYWHNTGTIGCFGACAAVADLLGLDATRFAHALATVATFSAGLQQAFRTDSMSKPLHAGRAAEAGLTAALAAAEGVTGSLDVLEGEAGFGKAMGDGPDWDRALGALGRDFHTARVTVKNHACCGHAFAAIDGALALKARMGVTAADIRHVAVGTYKAALDVAGCEDPRTEAEGRFSLKYVIATALMHGSVRIAAFAPDRLGEAATRALMNEVEVVVDPALDAGFPAQRAARVTIETRDGRRETFLQPTRVGDPDDPLSDEQLDAKFRELATPALGAARAEALLERLWRLDALASVDALGGPE